MQRMMQLDGRGGETVSISLARGSDFLRKIDAGTDGYDGTISMPLQEVGQDSLKPLVSMGESNGASSFSSNNLSAGTGSSSGSYSSADIFSQAQDVYAAGISEGKLRHWADLVSPTASTNKRGGSHNSSDDGQERINGDAGKSNSDDGDDSDSAGTDLPKVVDLHGFPLSVAETVIDYVLANIKKQHIRSGPTHIDGGGLSGKKIEGESTSSSPVLPCNYDVHLIVGRGHHLNSSGTRGVLQSEIKDYIAKKYGFDVQILPGNDGCLVVAKRAMNEWLLKSKGVSDSS